jgi:hypothetical protein
MIWGKRRFDGVEYIPYFERFEKLLIANGALYREFIMVSTKTDKPLTDDFYIGVPNKSFLAAFDGFEEISESELPKLIDTLHIADASTDNFKSLFQFNPERSR